MKSLSRGKLALSPRRWRIVRKCKPHPAPAVLLCCRCGLVGTHCCGSAAVAAAAAAAAGLLRLFLKVKSRLSVVMTSPHQCQCCVCSSCRMASGVDTTAAVPQLLAGLSLASAPAAAAAAAAAAV